MYTETLEKELRSIKWKDFNELETNKIEKTNIEIGTYYPILKICL